MQQERVKGGMVRHDVRVRKSVRRLRGGAALCRSSPPESRWCTRERLLSSVPATTRSRPPLRRRWRPRPRGSPPGRGLPRPGPLPTADLQTNTFKGQTTDTEDGVETCPLLVELLFCNSQPYNTMFLPQSDTCLGPVVNPTPTPPQLELINDGQSDQSVLNVTIVWMVNSSMNQVFINTQSKTRTFMTSSNVGFTLRHQMVNRGKRWSL